MNLNYTLKDHVLVMLTFVSLNNAPRGLPSMKLLTVLKAKVCMQTTVQTFPVRCRYLYT